MTSLSLYPPYFLSFFFNPSATTEIYTLSLHDALPISAKGRRYIQLVAQDLRRIDADEGASHDLLVGRHAHNKQIMRRSLDRKSTRLNSSHLGISYAVFCLKKKKKKKNNIQ